MDIIGALMLLGGWLVLFGAMGLGVGNNKGRPVAGFLLGAFLGPIGWIAVALGPDLRRKCPECFGVVPEGARRCKNCGVAI